MPGAEQPNFNDSAWRVLDVPHDWSTDNPYSRKNTPQNSWLPGGIGWYRKSCDMPANWTGRTVLVRFDSIYMNSTVWLNGQRVGGRPYGFMTFDCDLTPYLRPGRNVLAVRADNTPEPTLRYYHGSGINGHVNFLVLPKLHVRRDGGVFVRTKTATAQEARLAIDTELSEAATDTTISHRLLDDAGKTVAETSNQTLVVANPKLWSPESPYLYMLETSLLRQGQIVDRVLTPVGIRTIRFDGMTGFWLNGKNMKLNGVCEHIEIMPFGLGVPDSMHEWRLRILKAMGCNAIRAGHEVFPPAFFDLCDRLGILVMDEFCDGWRRKGANDYGGRFFKDWWKRDVRDWIRRDRNHPCVILWSIGNETGTKDDNNMTGWIHQFDDQTRPTTGGEVYFGVDVAGFNGWGGKPGVLEKFHADHPNIPVILSEEPHTLQTRGFYRVVTWWRDKKQPVMEFPPYGTTEIFTGDNPMYKSSYDNAGVRMCARTSFVRTKAMPWISGEFRWTGFESFGESQFMGVDFPKRTYNCGIIDLAGFPKDHYYLNQSQWTTAPMVHLLPHWTHPHLKPGTVIPVVAYSNCEEVELFLNDRSLGRQRPRKLLDFVWNVPYTPGTLKAIGYRNGKPAAEFQAVTTGDPVRLNVETSNNHLKPDRIDMSLLTLSALDAAGNAVPTANDEVVFRTTGPVNVRGFENGDPMDGTAIHDMRRKLFAGLARGYFQATAEDGPVEVTAAAILGTRQFVKQTTVAVDIQRVALRGSLAPAKFAIHYTLDGSQPTTASPLYAQPFTLDHPATVKALVVRDGKEWMTLETQFAKYGYEAPVTKRPENPCDKEVVGRWKEGKQIFQFAEDGSFSRIDGAKRTSVGRWWYDFPDDHFEAGKDAGTGELRWYKGDVVSQLKLTDQSARKIIITTGSKQRTLIKMDVSKMR
jgi:beta-galactosidase